jgi:hypothetical protein
MGMSTVSPGNINDIAFAGFEPWQGGGDPRLGTGMLSADEAKQYAAWQNAGSQGQFQYNPGGPGLGDPGLGVPYDNPNDDVLSNPGGPGLGDPGLGVPYDNPNVSLGGGGFNPPPLVSPNPPPSLPTQGSAGGKSGGLGNMFSGIANQIVNPLINNVASQAQTPQQKAIASGLGQAANNFNQTITAPLQQPMTQGTGQLPPGFGALSPIDRSQIGIGQIGMTGRSRNLNGPPANITTINSQNRLQPGGTFSAPTNTAARNPLAPNAPQGVFGSQGRAPVGGMQGIAMPGKTPAPAQRMNDLTYGAMQGRQAVVPTTNRQMTPLQQNRFAPPNAPGVRSKPITRPRIR